MVCIYKTNRFRLLLVNTVGIASINRTFTVGSYFLSDEGESSMLWIFRHLKMVYDQLYLLPPVTIVTDGDEALQNAICSFYPFTNHILCLWYIIKNVQLHTKQIFRAEALITRPPLS